jgi:hypothetical protein
LLECRAPQAVDDQHQAGCHQHHHRRRRQTPEAASVEAAEAHPAAACVFVEQQPGDQEPRQREEQGDAEKPAGGPRDVRVVRDDGDDRDGAQPIERVDPTLAVGAA